MRIIILGVSGLVGHKLLEVLSTSFETFGTLHNKKTYYGNKNIFHENNLIENIDVRNFKSLIKVLNTIDPDVIINCVGITKRKKEISDLIQTFEVNALFPHKLAVWAEKQNKRVIHFSTDCVFNGYDKIYTENSIPNAEDIYGRTKAFGEIKYKNSLTLRSSFIGLEHFGKTELLEWFLAQKYKKVKGYTNVLYSGVSTLFMANTINYILTSFPNLAGIYQLSTVNPISKYDLLCLAKKSFGLDIELVPDSTYFSNRVLDSSKIRSELDLYIPPWNEMMEQLSAEINKYN